MPFGWLEFRNFGSKSDRRRKIVEKSRTRFRLWLHRQPFTSSPTRNKKQQPNIVLFVAWLFSEVCKHANASRTKHILTKSAGKRTAGSNNVAFALATCWSTSPYFYCLSLQSCCNPSERQARAWTHFAAVLWKVYVSEHLAGDDARCMSSHNRDGRISRPSSQAALNLFCRALEWSIRIFMQSGAGS